MRDEAESERESYKFARYVEDDRVIGVHRDDGTRPSIREPHQDDSLRAGFNGGSRMCATTFA